MFQARDKALRYVQDYCARYVPMHVTTKHNVNDIHLRKPSFAKTHIQVFNKDAIDVAHQCVNPLVLILADDVTPGGCVLAGAGMQEESLFRRTALFTHLHPSMYPLNTSEALYCKNVPVLLTSEAEGYQVLAASPAQIAFIACPGLKMPSLVNGRLTDADALKLRNKIKLIIAVAQENGHAEVVFGALGCGVWGCPAKHVAELFAEVLTEHNGVLSKAYFAILGSLSNVFTEHLRM